MKILATLLLLTGSIFAQNYTTVTAMLQDSSTQIWANATWTTEFSKPPGVNVPFNNHGVAITANQTGTADASGIFTVVLDDNLQVSPAGSGWKFTICPNATVTSCNTIVLTITGTTQNITSQLNPILTVPVVNAAPVIARAYNDSEAHGTYGALYLNSVTNTLKSCNSLVCNGSGWVTVGGGGGSVTSVFGRTGAVVADPNDYASVDDVNVSDHLGNGLAVNTGGNAVTVASGGQLQLNGSTSNTIQGGGAALTLGAGNSFVLSTGATDIGGNGTDTNIDADPTTGSINLIAHQVTAPTVTPSSDSSTKVATTAFVQSAISGGGGSSGPPAQTGTMHGLVFTNSTTFSSDNTYPAGFWSHLQGSFTTNANVASNNVPPNYLSTTNTGVAGASSSIAEDAVAQQGNFSIFGAMACYCKIDHNATQIFWLAMSSVLYGSTVAVNPNATMFGFRWAGGTDTNYQAYVSVSNVSFTAVDTGVAPDNNFHGFFFNRNSTGGIDYWIDNVKVATIGSGATGFPGLVNTYAILETGLLANGTDSGVFFQSVRWWMRY